MFAITRANNIVTRFAERALPNVVFSIAIPHAANIVSIDMMKLLFVCSDAAAVKAEVGDTDDRRVLLLLFM